MSNVDVFEILVAAVCSANLAVFAITWVHELIVQVKKKRHERAEEQEMIMILKDKNHRFSDEICALRAKVTELEAKAIPKKPIGEGSYYLCPCCQNDLGTWKDFFFAMIFRSLNIAVIADVRLTGRRR
ncbi:MAG: hypothetical protein ACLRXY_05045 [Acutalibacteraceae bacterium]